MKKLLLVLILVTLSFAATASEKDVDMQTIQNTQTSPRSVVQKPAVTIDDETFQLSIKLAAPNESFTVYVYDEKGTVIYQSPVSTDGTESSYALPNLESGFYSIIIESSTKSFEGEFNI